MNVAQYDESGDLKWGYFYRLDVPFGNDSADWILRRAANSQDWIVSRDQNEYPTLWAEVLFDYEESHECPLDKSHVTGGSVRNIRADLYGRRPTTEIIVDKDVASIVVSRPLADRIKVSGLLGFNPTRLRIAVNQSEVANPDFYTLEAGPQKYSRKRTVLIPVPNSCPFCGWGPVVCPGCKAITYHCPKCQKNMVVSARHHGGSGDRRLTSSAIPVLGSIIEGSRWQGEDFMLGGFITKRALDWLLSIHAAPFLAQPIRVDVTGMSEDQLKQLEQAKKPIAT